MTLPSRTDRCSHVRRRCIHGERWLLLGGVLVLAAIQHAQAADWPMYRHDRARSGVTAEQIEPPLVQQWVYQPLHAPQPAWGEPNPRPIGGWHGLTEGRRMHFDDACQVAVAGGAVFFG
jgi:hypothetical protein